MIYVTGDTHGDITRFKAKELKKLKKNDILIICGDFGFIWDNSKQEQKHLKWLGKQKYTILFVEGCNENYNLLDRYEITEWSGGKVQQIEKNIYHLMRGEIYTIEGKTVFAFGGGDGSDSIGLNEEYDSLGREQPVVRETANGLNHLEQFHNQVDIIITHDAPATIKQFMDMDDNNISYIHTYLDAVSKVTKFKQWYFGKYHKNKNIPPYYHMLFTDIVPVEPSV